MPLTFTPLHLLFAAEAGQLLRTLATSKRWRRFAAAWTVTPCWFSGTRRSTMRSRWHSRSGSTGRCTPRPARRPSAKPGWHQRRSRIFQCRGRRFHPDADNRKRSTARQPPVAHRRLVPEPGGTVFHAACPGAAAARADTLFADLRAAYDALDDEMKARLEGLTCHHTITIHARTSASSSPPKRWKG